MSNPPSTPQKRSNYSKLPKLAKSEEDNNNARSKVYDCQQARTFVAWYKHMADNERQNLCLYLSDDATLEWFGRTIKTRKKVSAFLKYDMQYSRHDFTTIESIDKIPIRQQVTKRKDDSVLASPLVNEINSKTKSSSRKRPLSTSSSSPEWAEGCQPKVACNDLKRKKMNHVESTHPECGQVNINGNGDDDEKTLFTKDTSLEINSKGDGTTENVKRKYVSVTPPFRELGQGDCVASTSSDQSHDALNAQLTKLAVECNGYIKSTRMKNNRAVDAFEWERKCKVQISYSVDPLNIGEYIIWALRYTDESKCRRNLLAAFEEVAKEESKD